MKYVIRGALFALIFTTMAACGSPPPSESSGATAAAAPKDIMAELMNEEKISVDDAYGRLKEAAPTDESSLQMMERLETLMDCEGPFVQRAEDSKNQYTANVSFYFQKGELYSSLAYEGFIGQIPDTAVEDSDDPDYSFASFPIVPWYSSELEFKIHYGGLQLHIQWGDDIDYVLTRGDGTPDSVAHYETYLDDTDLFATLTGQIDETFRSMRHTVYFDREDMALEVVIQAPNNLRYALATGDSSTLESWQSIVDSMMDYSRNLTTALSVGKYAEFVDIFWVDRMNEEQKYEYTDYLLWVRNGYIMTNVADPDDEDDEEVIVETEAEIKTDAGHSFRQPSTRGEENALQRAYDYLDYTAFSYTGLIEQLEFEGYSRSEATYAADHCDADWNEQAAKKAQEYLDYTSFSRSGLIDQLIFEGFTESQAEYGVRAVY